MYVLLLFNIIQKKYVLLSYFHACIRAHPVYLYIFKKFCIWKGAKYDRMILLTSEIGHG